jgi:LemA protein
LSRAAQDDSALALHAAALHDARQRLSFARQYFNDAVRGHNEATQQFPTRLIAGLFGFASAGSL